MSEKDQNGQTPAPAPTGQLPAGLHEHHELQMILEFLRKNGTVLTITLGVVAVVLFGSSFYRRHQEKRRAEAASMLFTVNSVQDLDNLVSRYRSTPVAALGLLKLAKSQFDAGSYEMAINRYDEFKKAYPDHPLALAADLNRIHCMEAMGQTEQALAAFSAFSAANTNHFLRTQAIFGEGRCLESLGRTAEAKALYEDLIAAQPDGRWKARAEEMLRNVARRAPAAGPAAPPAPPPASGTVIPEKKDAKENAPPPQPPEG